MILLDTNICIYIINQKPPSVLERFKSFQSGEIGISTIVAAELAYGVEKTNSIRNKQALNLFLAPMTIVPFDTNCIWAYATLRAQLEKQGQPIGSLDTMIAAQALALDLPLVTNNLKEFSRVSGLKLENWV
ncbi:type II toxin-antitoxin system VapC family toxin [Polynucleobacter sp. AP-Feld-500C-C5]|uniref:type II toxin-antitoxin system tRNA(fMet)-specific endonuclease VapC n=1 Tax=Polynucleobacter sp. AP-Feld-500C-C5 TaxID=2576924 RepID=UPI002103F1B2|nr:type II toxin-antitoxin system VapC family toxin [Polynucleobacter sp. AP-Feld-500C-C5]MBU3633811.1 type II toxin-antitoxin system VapC family toxin [Polynucleobacter sp. AP-Feld-500C-C5]